MPEWFQEEISPLSETWEAVWIQFLLFKLSTIRSVSKKQKAICCTEMCYTAEIPFATQHCCLNCLIHAPAQITWVPVLAQPTCHSFPTSSVSDFPSPISRELRREWCVYPNLILQKEGGVGMHGLVCDLGSTSRCCILNMPKECSGRKPRSRGMEEL